MDFVHTPPHPRESPTSGRREGSESASPRKRSFRDRIGRSTNRHDNAATAKVSPTIASIEPGGRLVAASELLGQGEQEVVIQVDPVADLPEGHQPPIPQERQCRVAARQDDQPDDRRVGRVARQEVEGPARRGPERQCLGGDQVAEAADGRHDQAGFQAGGVISDPALVEEEAREQAAEGQAVAAGQEELVVEPRASRGHREGYRAEAQGRQVPPAPEEDSAGQIR